ASGSGCRPNDPETARNPARIRANCPKRTFLMTEAYRWGEPAAGALYSVSGGRPTRRASIEWPDGGRNDRSGRPRPAGRGGPAAASPEDGVAAGPDLPARRGGGRDRARRGGPHGQSRAARVRPGKRYRRRSRGPGGPSPSPPGG